MSARKQTIIRAPRDKDNPYFAYRRKTAQDLRLSFESRGVLAYLLSKPGDWKISVPDLMREGHCGRDRVLRILKELEGAGYLFKEKQTQDNVGKFLSVPLSIREIPCTENQDTDTGTPFTGNPSTGEPSTENPQVQNRDSTDKKDTDSTDTSKNDVSVAGVPASANPKSVIEALPASSVVWETLTAQQQAQAMFQAICDVFGYDTSKLTKDARGKINNAEAQLREVGAKPDDVPRIHGFCVRTLDHFGPNALASQYNNWLVETQTGGTQEGYDNTPSYHEATQAIPTLQEFNEKARRVRELIDAGEYDKAAKYTFEEMRRERTAAADPA